MKAPFVYVASATGIGGRWENGYGGLTDNILAGGFGTVLLMDRYTKPAQVSHMQSKGLKVWAWDEPGDVRNPDGHEYNLAGLTNERFVAMGYDGVVLQTETPGQRDGALRMFQGGLAAGCEKHIVTYYFGFDDGLGPAYWTQFKAAGVTKVHVEGYAADNHADVKAYVDYGANLLQCPRDEIIEVFGVYRGEFPSAYSHVDSVGRVYGCYIVDNWPDAASGDPSLAYWKTWGGVNKMATPLQYWRILGNVTNKILFETRANTDATGTGLDRVETWIGSHEQTIRDEKGFSLIKVEH